MTVSVAELASIEALRKLSPPEAYDTGVELSDDDRVLLEELHADRVTASIRGDRSARAEIRVVDGTLQWSCTCGEAEPSMCRHVVAAAVETWRQTPPGSVTA